MTAAALLSAAIHTAIAIFQVLLVTGKPWGEYAWGGQHRGVLPRPLRFGSAVSAVVLLGFALINLQSAGITMITMPGIVVLRLQWAISVYAGLGTVMNAISRSRRERLLWTPVCAVLLALNAYLLYAMPC
ncbi:MAG: hypothetical protein U1F40_11525 [Turneriella sp.]